MGDPQHVLVPGVVPPEVQNYQLPLELHDVPVRPFLQTIYIPLDNSTILWCVCFFSQFCIIWSLADGKLCLVIQLTNKDVKQDWTQY